jgi:uncharacterized protein YeaO (DUF488 family)
MLKIYSAQYNYKGKDRLDITAKGQDPIGKIFAPPWNLVMGYKDGSISQEEYNKRYNHLLAESYLENTSILAELFSREEVTLVCFCKAHDFCHRYILAGFLCKVGNAVYMGERGEEEMNINKEPDYTDALLKLAETCLTPKGFKMLMFLDGKIPDIWDRPSSSTGKYHKKEDRKVPTIAHHTYEMLYAASKAVRMLGDEVISSRNDALLMGIILHDALKYGPTGITPHTSKTHDKQMADLMFGKKNLLMKIFNEEEFELFIDVIRYHSGRWSSDLTKEEKKNFTFKDHRPEILIVHFLDMLSTIDCLKFKINPNLPF